MGGTETILLVEDDEGVRRLSRSLLNRRGYHVIEAADADQAFALAGESATIDLLLTDVVLPRSSGPDLYVRLAALRPLMRVLYISGHTEASIIQRGVPIGGMPFLHKPFTGLALIGAVRAALGAGDAMPS